MTQCRRRDPHFKNKRIYSFVAHQSVKAHLSCLKAAKKAVIMKGRSN